MDRKLIGGYQSNFKSPRATVLGRENEQRRWCSARRWPDCPSSVPIFAKRHELLTWLLSATTRTPSRNFQVAEGLSVNAIQKHHLLTFSLPADQTALAAGCTACYGSSVHPRPTQLLWARCVKVGGGGLGRELWKMLMWFRSWLALRTWGEQRLRMETGVSSGPGNIRDTKLREWSTRSWIFSFLLRVFYFGFVLPWKSWCDS